MTSSAGSLRISPPISDRHEAFRAETCSTCGDSPRYGPTEKKVQPLAAQIGWTHHQVLIDAFRDDRELYAWYAGKAVENRWSRRQLTGQIHLRLHERQGAPT